MKKIIAILVLNLIISSPLYAQSVADLTQIEDYLNNIKTMQADFVQTASNGNSTEGTLLIQKPNKIRMEYAQPTNVLIVGDGKYIVYNDIDLEQVTHIDYEDIPASLILANDVKIDGKKFKTTNFYKDSGSTSITLEYADNKEIGPITLIFGNSPFELKQWKIIDPQSVEITVSLYDVIIDIPLDENNFKFKKNKLSKQKKGKIK